MALLSLLLVAAALGVAAIVKFLSESKKNRLPIGVQKLPGPKGLSSLVPIFHVDAFGSLIQ